MSLNQRGKRLATRVVKFQSVVIVALGVLLAVLANNAIALSFLAGGGAGIIPGAVFGYFAFRYGGASKNQLVVRSFSQGSKLKLALMIVILVVALKIFAAQPLPLVAGLVVSIIAQWLALVSAKKEF